MVIKNHRNLRIVYISLLVMGVGLFLCEDFVLAINYFNPQKPIIGLKLYGQRISNLNQSQLIPFIRIQVKQTNKPLTLTYQDLNFTISRSDVDPSFDSVLVARSLIKEGRVGSIFNRVWTQTKALLGFDDKKIKSNLSKKLLKSALSRIALVVNQDPLPPMPDFANDINKTLPSRNGISIDANQLALLMSYNILHPSSEPIAIPVVSVPSQYKDNELSGIRKEALSLVNEPISIKSAGQIFTLSRDDLFSVLTVVERPDPKNNSKTKLVLRIDNKKMDKRLGDFAANVQNITHAEFNDHDAHRAIYSQFYSGTRNLIDIPAGSGDESMSLQNNGKKVSSLTASISDAVTNSVNSSGEKFVYLTFDDGPNNIYHPLILDILKQYNIKATFFLVGENAKKFDAITKRTVDEGHVIGDHTMTHVFLPKLSSESIFKEVKNGKEALDSFVRDQGITLLRPPYGGINPTVKKSAKDLNLKTILWSVDPRDWTEPDTNELVSRVISNAKNGSDILMHSNHLATVRALPKIIETLKNKGYSFKTLPQ